MAGKPLAAEVKKQETVVFKAMGSQYQTLVLKTGKLYDVSGMFTDEFEHYCSPTYCVPVVISGGLPSDSNVKIKMEGNPLEIHDHDQGCHGLPVFFYGYYYSFKDGIVFRRGLKSSEWTAVSKLPLTLAPVSTAVFINAIILLYDSQNPENSDKIIEVYSFSPRNFRTQKVANLTDSISAATFYCAGKLHVLTGRGDLFCFEFDDVAETQLRLDRCYYGEDKTQCNWDFDIFLCGAVASGKELIVFSNELPHDQRLPDLKVTEYDLKVTFIQILADGACHFVKLPESWLTKEI